MLIARVRLLAAFLPLACNETAPQEALPLDQVLASGQVRAGVIRNSKELIGGDVAKGRVGDPKLYNSKIAVVVASVGNGDGFNPYGGDLLDADLARGADEPGRSSFGEILVGLELGTLAAEHAEVVNDGRDGKAAVLRIRGRLGPIPLFDAVIGALVDTKPPELEISLDYVLEPDVPWLRMDYTVRNPATTNLTVEVGAPLLGLVFGEAKPFFPGYGFIDGQSGVLVDHFAAVTEETSYLYGAPGESISTLFTDAGTNVGTMGSSFPVRAKESKTFSHYLIVGDGDLGNTQALWNELSGGGEQSVLSGVVRREDGSFVGGAHVHVSRTEAPTAERSYQTRSRTDGEGRFSIPLPGGSYELVATAPGRLVSAAERVTLTSAGEEGVELVLPNPSAVRYRIRDEGSRALPSKLTFVRTSSGAISLPERFGEEAEPSGVAYTEYGIKGEGRLELSPGRYHVYVSRGAEYEVKERDLELVPGGELELFEELAKVIDTTGWMSTDTHIHAQLSNDSPDLYPFKVSALVVEGIELPVSTEHEALGDFNPAIRALGLDGWIQGVIGSEISTLSYGHFNGFPLVQDFSKPGNGAIQWLGKPPAETFRAIRENPGDPYLQVNHPNGTAFKGYFSAMGFDATTLTARNETFSTDFDGIEIANGCGEGQIDREVREWFSFLNHGHKKFATGSTDSHRAREGQLGFPRTYLRMPTDEPREAKIDDFRAAAKGGHMVVTCGPFVEIQAGGKGVGELLPVGPDGRVDLAVRVAAPDWVDVDRLEVVLNGVSVTTVPFAPYSSPVRFQDTIPLETSPGADGWVVVLARGDERHGLFADREPSWAVTNPIFLDGDRDGTWKMR